MPDVKKRILDDLERLPPDKQEHAARLVHELVKPLPKGTPLSALLSLPGTLDEESARQMEAAIEEHFEQVEDNGW